MHILLLTLKPGNSGPSMPEVIQITSTKYSSLTTFKLYDTVISRCLHTTMQYFLLFVLYIIYLSIILNNAGILNVIGISKHGLLLI